MELLSKLFLRFIVLLISFATLLLIYLSIDLSICMMKPTDMNNQQGMKRFSFFALRVHSSTPASVFVGASNARQLERDAVLSAELAMRFTGTYSLNRAALVGFEHTGSAPPQGGTRGFVAEDNIQRLKSVGDGVKYGR